MEKGYALRLFEPVVTGTAFVQDLTPRAMNWQRAVRLMGGCWQGSFSLTGDLSQLQEFFYQRLGYHIEERVSGTLTWEGMIYAMELQNAGVRRRRSLDLMANAVWARYISGIGVVAETSVATEDDSITRYGRKEEMISLDGFPQAAAEARRDTMLAEHAWPWARPLGVSPLPGGAILNVVVCGYVFTANWEYVTVDDGAMGNVSGWVEDIVDTDCPFLTVGRIDTNTLQVKRELTIDQRAWDTLAELALLGDADGDPWRFYVEIGRTASYEQVDITPRYYLRDNGLYDSLGSRMAVTPWLVQPGVVRDAQYPVTRAEPGSFLDDARDILVDEVEVSTTSGLMLKTTLISEEEMLAARQEWDR